MLSTLLVLNLFPMKRAIVFKIFLNLLQSYLIRKYSLVIIITLKSVERKLNSSNYSIIFPNIKLLSQNHRTLCTFRLLLLFPRAVKQNVLIS